MTLTRTRLFGFGALLLVLSLVLVGPLAGLAQEGATPEDAGAVQSHPAHIHTGTCDDIGEVVYPLANVAPRPPAGGTSGATTPAAESADMMGGMVTGIQAEVSVTIVDVALADLLASPYLVNVHLSEEEVGTYIACGEIVGLPDADNSVYVGLRELNDSGYSGITWLRDNGDGTTYVTIFLAQGLQAPAMMEEATPEMAATPAMATPEMAATPALATPERAASPEVVATPEMATPAMATPVAATPAMASPVAATPGMATPEAATPEGATPEA